MPLTTNEAFHRYKSELPRIDQVARLTAEHLRRRAARRHLSCQISHRAKDVSSFVKKAYHKGYEDPWVQIHDKAGIRIVVQHSGLLDQALDLVRQSLVVERVKDGRATPGREERLEYARLHVQVRSFGEEEDPDGNPYECEVQIRTEAEDLWARMSHSLMYKSGASDIPGDVRRSLYRLIALVELYDSEVERGVKLLTEHPDFTRSNRLLAEAERIYRTFTDHPYNRGLSEEVVDVLLEAIEDDVGYCDQLVQFAEEWRDRLQRAYQDYGPTSEHFLGEGRYMLASQPESLIIFERLANASFLLQGTWEDALPDSMLKDMAKIWGTAL
ncbi:hypothetical protein [Kitasatospora sp. NPDC059327]|uniref:hypothetical protein n=1 Tax=Kitasatospora sp. NPDC059327 TaxID=3346803 RepID=UPI003699773C